MCGLAGWVGREAVSDETVESIARAIRHRGPDGSASKRFANAGLIHTRLRIIDLSPTGDQPMSNEDGSVWTVFNGEIYNHHDLRRELEGSGHRFRGTADTEVLPHLYEEHGVGMFERLRGMFTVVIVDTREGRLLIGRDRFGIKPLFFAHNRAQLAFASEIAALRLFPGIDLTANRQAIADYAALSYVPAPATIFEGIEALEPGCAIEAVYSSGRVDVVRRCFHRWAPQVDLGLGLEEAKATADELIDASVARQLESDVPLGAMLSGGIDSTLVSAAAQRGLAGNLLTFNVRPSDRDHDETSFATAVAQHLGTRHATVEMERGAADWDAFWRTLRQLGQPIADPALFAVGAVSRAMRKHVTVALSGDGGDELFGGYRTFWKIEMLSRLRRLPAPALGLVGTASRPLAARRVIGSTVPNQLSSLAAADDTALLQSLSSELEEAEHANLLTDPSSVASPRRLFERTWQPSGLGRSRLERLSSHAVEIDVRLLLPNKFLFKTDMASMREGLEVRVPLLDESIAEFGLALPHRLRVRGRSGKRVLREVARRYVPAEIAARPKHGFAIPIDSWVDREFRENTRDVLLDPGSPVADHFRRAVYEPWVAAFAEEREFPRLTKAGLVGRVLMLTALDASLRR